MNNKIYKYKHSEFVKEDLPTWNEIYYDFLLKYPYIIYEPETDKDDLDKYWKVPKKLFILSTICNQLNKMIEEDDIKLSSILVDDLNNISDVNNFKFILGDSNDDLIFKDFTPIYTLTKSKIINPFIKNYNRRIKVNNFINKRTELIISYQLKSARNKNSIFIINSCSQYKDIIDSIFSEVYNYYKDEVGWK